MYEYTETPNKARIVREGWGERPWQVDAFDTRDGSCTEECAFFPTFEEAVAALPRFLQMLSNPEQEGSKVNNDERRQWIYNDAGLYYWWRDSRQSMTAFIRENRAEIDAAIDRVLN